MEKNNNNSIVNNTINILQQSRILTKVLNRMAVAHDL